MKYLILLICVLCFIGCKEDITTHNTQFEFAVCQLEESSRYSPLYCVNGDIYYVKNNIYYSMFAKEGYKYRCTCIPENVKYIIKQDLNLTLQE